MERYDSYKDSGVEWIGDIPSHWDRTKVKYLGNVNSGDGLESSLIEDEGDYPVFGGNGVMGYYSDFNQSREVLSIGRVGEKCGNVHFINEKVWINDNSLVFEPNNNVETLWYIFHSLTQRNLNQLRNKNTQPLITGTLVKNEYIPVPPFPEQQKIVSFLNAKTSIIDSLIEKTQRKIELLKEGIMSYIFYKSNTNYYQDYWFQNIPDGWKTLKFREVFEDIVDKGHQDERLLSVHQIKGVIYRDEQEQSVMNPSGDISNYKLIKEGDFVISLRSSEGGFEFSQVRGLVSPVYTVLRPKFKIDTVLFKYLFKSENFIQEINRYITGIREGKTINYKDIRDIPIPIPDNFQESVVSKHLKILELFDLWEKRNNKLKEYRQSLISEVVTGKRKVV